MGLGDWLIVAAAAAMSLVVGMAACRWWYGQRMVMLLRQVARLEESHQSAHRTVAQARKQVEDLQRIVSEYRRRHGASESARRRAAALATVLDEEHDDAPRRVAPAGGWADTQPL
jgi:flagellar biosynthesis chaperone FliJ